MQALLLLWTVIAAAGVALSVPLAGGPAAAEHGMGSGLRQLAKRGFEEDRSTAVRTVASCMWDSWVYGSGGTMDWCVKKHGASRYRLSTEEVKSRWIQLCLNKAVQYNDEACQDNADRHFGHRHPVGLRDRVTDLYRGVARTSSAVIRGVKRTGGRAWSWAKSKFNRPSAFQTAAGREQEAVGVMHPLRPILVGGE
ncbi:MAG: hypothetical protein M1826_003283 [Phylliscum demangeonii]|nr:MAG: hypothetical protein M1826_003283 [Phylliscum demangeonii]